MYQVSILVPIYEVEKYIERCARSLFEQTYDNLEYIFVDDCSPDKSMEILEQVMEDYPNRKKQVRIIRHEHNRGLAAARNTALDAATSPFITHVDSDDYLSLDAIHLLVNKQVETDADIVSGNYFVIESNRIKKAYEPDYVDQ
ncbi:MAG: glycosyltransferase family 2 protein, partial [Bacteroidales bacterium]|nr:glycosyltransferase family 2 protein [Bacteroidales bacterium]